MIKRIKTNKGVVDPVSMILIAVVVLAVALVFYFALGKQRASEQASTPVTEPTISASDEIDVMEEELEMIDVGDVEDDLQELEAEVSTL